MATDADEDEFPGIDRLLALTDGVVAIALTLLVLQLQVPVTHLLKTNPDSARVLWDALDVDAAEMSSYLVSFLVIAQFWLVHHRILRSMRGTQSEGLAWRNFGFLLAPLTLMPFTSDLIGRYGNNPVAITLFGINTLVADQPEHAMDLLLYAARHNLLTEEARSLHDERAARVRVVLVIVIVSVSLAFAWTDPRLAKYVWLLFLLAPTTSERITRLLEKSRWPTRSTERESAAQATAR